MIHQLHSNFKLQNMGRKNMINFPKIFIQKYPNHQKNNRHNQTRKKSVHFIFGLNKLLII